MPYLQHPDFKLHYTSEGRGETAIVLLHGNFGSQRHWSLFCDKLHPSFSAYAVDLRGCGDSEAPQTGYDIETLSEDVFFFINEMGIKSFHLVGHSLGGAIISQVAEKIFEKIEKHYQYNFWNFCFWDLHQHLCNGNCIKRV